MTTTGRNRHTLKNDNLDTLEQDFGSCEELTNKIMIYVCQTEGNGTSRLKDEHGNKM